ncbi:melanoma inhibitory activity protein 2-like [Ochotona princeps]|uniref:melanoma inhibitory activity protein 2-like n=1 Tax=Ochotona princeps TaxID=9978 RepID=UPI0027146D26|nr:melanoma inhibitory activity protein 2-like [Ochotona princeps]
MARIRELLLVPPVVKNCGFTVKNKKLAVEVSGIIQEKRELLDKHSFADKENENLEPSLKHSSVEESNKAQALKETHEKLESCKFNEQDDVFFLEKQLEKEKSEHFEQNALAKRTTESFQTRLDLFKVLIENLQLHESLKQLVGEAKIPKQELNGLKEKMTFICTTILTDQPINDNENQIEMENCSAILGEDIADDDSVEQDMKSDSENEHIESHLIEQIPLKSEETQFGSEIGTHPQEVPIMTEVYQGNDMMPCRWRVKVLEQELERTIDYFQLQIIYLKKNANDNWWAARFAERELDDLKKEYVYKRKRYLMVEENCQLDQRADVSLVDEDWDYTATEILMYRNRINDLEIELQRTFHYYQEEIVSVQKETHNNWLAACIAERSLNDLKQENKRKMYLMVEENCQLDQRADVSLVDEVCNYTKKEILIYRKRVEDLEQEMDRTIRNSQRLILSYDKEAQINWRITVTSSPRLVTP